ncbi:hypothetical protein [Rhodococcoides yunnanense]|uniref:Uncharacterized protein n=1 Tax=Rhodococcoides yunnanense TaxID=278209 RepID=A0ABU4BDK0_9NOCA|nr:hypothetical protein [Rhodococcus yunnanensis]MDV6262179.1 hypothetical protein [Rhodococcus yunnanensis]
MTIDGGTCVFDAGVVCVHVDRRPTPSNDLCTAQSGKRQVVDHALSIVLSCVEEHLLFINR